MKRITGFPTRPNMVQQLLDVGFDYYNLPSSDGSHYWSDNVAYEFTLAEIDRIEDATNEITVSQDGFNAIKGFTKGTDFFR